MTAFQLGTAGIAATMVCSSVFAAFSDVAGDVGLVLSHDISDVCSQPPIGVGSAWADYDNDGDPDLFVTNHGGANHLYRNEGDTNEDGLPDFVDVAVDLNVDTPETSNFSAVFIDYDNDGDQDLYVTGLNSNQLYQNRLVEDGAVAFVDVAGPAGLVDDGNAITTSWADFDGDGDLDVYLAKHFAKSGICSGMTIHQDRLYRNENDGTFTDKTSLLCPDGIVPCAQVNGLGFTAGWFDYDEDGDLDLYLANDNINGDYYPNVLWRNDGEAEGGDWVFTDVSVASGTNLSINSMGLGVGDFDNDGFLDIAVSDIAPGKLLKNVGDTTFENISVASGIDAVMRETTWATVFFDYDNDGYLDLFFGSGPISSAALSPNYLFKNNGDATFTDVSVITGMDDGRRNRNASIVDLDDDGLVDVFVGNYGQTPALYHNENGSGVINNWLTVTVEGTISNRDGIGSRMWLTTPDFTQQRMITSGYTHGGGDFKAAYFGLGSHGAGDLVVRWPTGQTLFLGRVSSNQKIHLVEGDDEYSPFLNINSSQDEDVIISATGLITVYGTATDDQRGDNGVQSVTVNGVPTADASVPGSELLNWSAEVQLTPGLNSISVSAIDGSVGLNEAIREITVHFALDTDGDGAADDQDNCLLVANADQVDADSDGLGNQCDFDMNNDCFVNFTDLGLFKAVFLSNDAVADFEVDGIVNFLDLTLMKEGFLAAPGPSGIANVCDGG